MSIGNDPFGVRKLDAAETDGLSGVHDSLAYRVAEIERHFHNRERWLGLAASPSGETHRADEMAGGIQPFTLTAGNDAWGEWVQVLGSEDTPVTAGAAYMDTHRFIVTDTNSTNPYVFQIATGESTELPGKIIAGEYTMAPYISSSNLNDSGISSVMSVRAPTGSKIWIRCACIGSNGTTISFYYGIHEYEG